MAIDSLRGLNFGAGSLLGGYLRQARAELGSRTAQRGSEPAQVTANQLKARLLSLGDRIQSFDQLSGGFGGGGSISGAIEASAPNSTGEGAATGSGDENVGATPAAPERVSYQIVGSGRRAGNFSRQVSRALSRGGESGDDKILKNRNLSGEIKFSIGEGESAKSFSVHVDGSTTYNDVVSAFNAQAGGRAQASLHSSGGRLRESDDDHEGRGGRGESRVRINIQTIAQPLPPPVEGETNPAIEPPAVRNDLLSGSDSELDTESIRKDLKGFVSEFNRLTRLSDTSASGENVLAATAVDEAAVQDVRQAIANSASEDGSIKLDQILRQDSNGSIKFDEARFQALAAENPDGLVEALRSLADEISGRKGIVNRYTGRQNLVDRAITNVETQVAQGITPSASSSASSSVASSTKRADQLSRFDESASAVQTARVRTVA